MPKTKLGHSVLEATRRRISETFDLFERIYLSFSGGKDSTVMFHLVAEEARKRKQKIGILLIDLEGQYQLTIKHAKKMFKEYRDTITPFWLCLPLSLRNAVSVYEPQWICWDENRKKDWVRSMPKRVVPDYRRFNFFRKGMEFEEFMLEFGEWYSRGKECACFVGIRSDESLDRYRAVANGYVTKVTEHVSNIYPIYDWKTEDIWTYHGRFTNKQYNRLYDYMYKAGLTIHQMRICQPFGDDQKKGLWLYHLIEPDTWGRIVARVNGVNSGALYIKEIGNINGSYRIEKPEGHTWKSFAELLVGSMPAKTGDHYRMLLGQFVRTWEGRGYKDGIPDEAPIKLERCRNVPSWRRICKTVLSNDYWCKGLGFSQPRSEAFQKVLDLRKG